MSGGDVKLNERNGLIYVDFNLFSDVSPAGWEILDRVHNCVGTINTEICMFIIRFLHY